MGFRGTALVPAVVKDDAHSPVGFGIGGEDADLFARLVEGCPHGGGWVRVPNHLGKNKPVGFPTGKTLHGSSMGTTVSLHIKADGTLFRFEMNGVLLGGARSFCGPFS